MAGGREVPEPGGIHSAAKPGSQNVTYRSKELKQHGNNPPWSTFEQFCGQVQASSLWHLLSFRELRKLQPL